MTKENDYNDDPIEKAFKQFHIYPEYDYDDVVAYEGLHYFVDGYVFEAARMVNVEDEDIHYELTRVYPTGEWSDYAMSYSEDLRLIKRADGTRSNEQIKEVSKLQEPQKVDKETDRQRKYHSWVDMMLDYYNEAESDDEKDTILRALREESEKFTEGE